MKSRKPAAAAGESTQQQQPQQPLQKPEAPTRPISPMTPPSPFLQQVSPSSRPPSPFLQSPSSATKRKRSDEDTLNTAASSALTFAHQLPSSTRKRHHSPSPPRSHPSLSSTGGLARHDSHGHTESTLVEQIVTMRFHSAAPPDGPLLDADRFGLDAVPPFLPPSKEVPEQKEEEGGAVIQRYILQGLDVMKGGVKSEKREDAEVMSDISKMREEMDDECFSRVHPHAPPRCHDDEDDDLDAIDDAGNATDHDAASVGEGGEVGGEDGDCRAWKRARHELHGTSPSSPSSGGRRRRGGGGRGDEGSDFDASSAPSSPHAHDDQGVDHAFDSFSAVKPHPSTHFDDPLVDKVDDAVRDQQTKVTDVVEHSTLLSV